MICLPKQGKSIQLSGRPDSLNQKSIPRFKTKKFRENLRAQGSKGLLKGSKGLRHILLPTKPNIFIYRRYISLPTSVKKVSQMQKCATTFARLRMIVSTAVRTGLTSPLFAKTRKSRNFHFLDFWRQIHPNAIIFRFSGPKSDFSRPGSRMCL